MIGLVVVGQTEPPVKSQKQTKHAVRRVLIKPCMLGAVGIATPNEPRRAYKVQNIWELHINTLSQTKDICKV